MTDTNTVTEHRHPEVRGVCRVVGGSECEAILWLALITPSLSLFDAVVVNQEDICRSGNILFSIIKTKESFILILT